MPTPAPGMRATPAAPAAPTQARPSVPPTPAPEPPLPLLGQVAPETIYWVPEAITDGGGQFLVELPLPDVPSTWRMTVLASTLSGALGEAELLLPATP
jgi:hypothetical protein